MIKKNDLLMNTLIQISSNPIKENISRSSTYKFVKKITDLLFPENSNVCFDSVELKSQWEQLILDMKTILYPIRSKLKSDSNEIANIFFNKLPNIYCLLEKDAETIFNSDPASYSVEEIILAYPGFYAIMIYRLSHQLYLLDIPILPRMISEYAHSRTGIDINPGAQIGKCFFIDHGSGIVIGETAIIGNNVKIYQGVTIGALSVKKENVNKKRHPTIEDNVIIYSGTTILGGNVIIGHNSIIGGNVWLTESVQPYSVVYHNPEIKIRNKKLKSFDQFTFII